LNESDIQALDPAALWNALMFAGISGGMSKAASPARLPVLWRSSAWDRHLDGVTP